MCRKAVSCKKNLTGEGFLIGKGRLSKRKTLSTLTVMLCPSTTAVRLVAIMSRKTLTLPLRLMLVNIP